MAKLRALLDEQGYKCALTGWELTPTECDADHIVPVSMGGASTMENIQLLHPIVNRAKGSLPQQQFIDMCAAIASRANGGSLPARRAHGA